MNKFIGVAIGLVLASAGISQIIKSYKEEKAVKRAAAMKENNPNPSEPEEATMEFDYYAYPLLTGRSVYDCDVSLGRLARVVVAGVDVYVDASDAKAYDLAYAEPEAIDTANLIPGYLDVQRDNGFGFTVYVTDDAHYAIIAPALSILEGIETVSVKDNQDLWRRWKNGVAI